jgi:hypothetical protein
MTVLSSGTVQTRLSEMASSLAKVFAEFDDINKLRFDTSLTLDPPFDAFLTGLANLRAAYESGSPAMRALTNEIRNGL